MNNIYNAIQNLYNMDKTTWQEVLAELYNLVANVENKFDLFELKFGTLLGDHVTRELKKMYDNGSLATLVNDVLLQDINKKVDTFKTEISEQLDKKANIKKVVWVNALDLGFKINDPTFNCTTKYFEILPELNDKTKIYFPSGDWYWDECLITNEQTTGLIYGEKMLSAQVEIGSSLNPKYKMGTVFKPFRKNQRYIFKLGGDERFSTSVTNGVIMLHGFRIEGVNFTDYINSQETRKLEKAFIYCEYIANCVFDIGFYKHKSTAFFIRNSWECDIEAIHLRGDQPEEPQIIFGACDKDNASNLSKIHFKNIDAEYRITKNSPILKTLTGCNAGNIIIDTISYEDITPINTIENNQKINIDTFLRLTKLPIFDLSEMNGLMIGNINLHVFSDRFDVIDNEKFISSVFRFNSKCLVSVNTILLDNSGGKIQLIDGVGSSDSLLSINSLVSDMINRTGGDSYINGFFRGLYYYDELKNGMCIVNNTTFKKNVYSEMNSESQIINNGSYNAYELYNKLFRFITDGVSNWLNVVYDGDEHSHVLQKGLLTEMQVTNALIPNSDCIVYITYKANTPFKICSALSDEIVPSSDDYTTYEFNFKKDGHKMFFIKATDFNIKNITIVNNPIKTKTYNINISNGVMTSTTPLGFNTNRVLGYYIKQSDSVFTLRPNVALTSTNNIWIVCDTNPSETHTLEVVVSYI